MSWLPEQHEEQLQLSFRIIENAFKGKVHGLEQEVRALRLTNEDHSSQLSGLKKKNSNLECELLESHQRSQQLAEENKELFKTVSQLKKQISRLEELKKKVLTSLNDTENQMSEDHNSAVYMNDEYLRSAVPMTAGLGGNRGGPYPAADTYRADIDTNRASPKPQSEGSYALSGLPSQEADAQGSVDGRMFFRSARARLSYEAFNAFLANIKRLNNHQQTRDETLAEAEKIFGPDHKDLYRDFVQLLNRHA